jgi:diguanylate cyclase
MEVACPRHDEVAAIAALRGLEVLDSQPEAEFDALVRAASVVCGTPISAISLIDVDRPPWRQAFAPSSAPHDRPRPLRLASYS